LTLNRLQGKMSKSCYEAAKFSEETTAAEAAGQRRRSCGAVLRFVGSFIDVIGSALTSPVNRPRSGSLAPRATGVNDDTYELQSGDKAKRR
jgi:hypothetical protein